MSLHAITRGFRRLFRNAEAERDLGDEVAQYIALATEEHMRRGLSREEAERRARIDFGGTESAKEAVRTAGWDGVIATIGRDIAYGARALKRNPGFTAVALATLALGIGANTAMFTVVNAVILRPLPYRDADRVALIWTDDVRRGLRQEMTAIRTIEDWRDARSFQQIALYSTERSTLNQSGARTRTRTAYVSQNLFTTLGVHPVQGRAFTVDEEVDASRVAVISHSLWLRLGGDSSVIGRVLPLEVRKFGTQPRVIGVMAPGFYFPDRQTEIWTPASTYGRFVTERAERFDWWSRRWIAVGRLAAGASVDDARRDLARIGHQLGQTHASTVPDFPGFGTTVMPILDSVAGQDLQSALWILLGAVSLVLLVACANVANLLLARGASRQQEFAIRSAIGAGRARLVGQLVAESMVLAVAGGLLGVLLAALATRLLVVAGSSQVPRIAEATIDGRVLLFAAAVSVVAGLIFGVLPALRVSGPTSSVLKEGSGASSGVRHTRTRGLLVVAECSVAIVLLAGAGLLLRSLSRLQAVDPGFDASSVLSVRIEFPPDPRPAVQASSTEPSELERAYRREQLMRDLTRRVVGIPGVEGAEFVDDMYIAGSGNHSIAIPGRSLESGATAQLNEGNVTPGFFAMMRVPLRRGRYPTRDDIGAKMRALWAPINNRGTLDDRQRAAVYEPVVVNEAFARRFFPTDDPVGQRFATDPTGKTYWYEIVGVVGDMHRQGLDRRPIPEFYGAYFPQASGRADLFVRTRQDPRAIVASVRQAVADVVPGAIVVTVSTAGQDLRAMHAQRDFQTRLLSAFAVLALLLAAVGIYGVVHYAVAERTREIGVRIALGAAPGDVMRLVIGQGMRTPALGIAVGLVVAFLATRLLTHMLFDVQAADPATFGGVAIVLALVAAVACWFPARRATRVDAVTALRRG